MRFGRPFTEQDSNEAPKIVIINETLARRFLPNENPIGHRLMIGPCSAPRPTMVMTLINHGDHGRPSLIFDST
jgi:hypothetical protein